MRRALFAAFLIVAVAAPLLPAADPPVMDPETRFNIGLAHLRDGRPQLALEEFRRAVKQDARNPYFHKGLGLAHAALRQYGDATASFRKALELNPYYVDVRNDLGTALILAGKRAEGKTEFLTAFNDPTNPTPEVSARNLGQAHFEERNYNEAINWFRTSLSRNKSYADAYLGLSDALLALNKAAEAATVLETGVRECPDAAAVQVSLGDAYFRLGRFADARLRLEEAQRKDPMGADGRRAAELLKHFPVR
ncbi:MAG TPA: tetratricopeptide repeat protein [Vicinamibacteria bacterium]|nr:tetratricopeptide repeat protein [Vicinamibacteria bacterium]